MNIQPLLAASFGEGMLYFVTAAIVFIIIGGLLALLTCYRKVAQGQALVKNGVGGTKVSFSGMVIYPIIHRAEYIDISVKRVEIDRQGKNGLICMDNMRADIKVAFFVRVNKTPEDVLKVAQSIGCDRASSQQAIIELFDAKFSEGLKTVGRQFQFVELYNSRDKLKEGILKTVGTDLNGFVLDDVAIDYLEQTPLALLNADNILDSEGIKKITELTATQKVLANKIDNEREKPSRSKTSKAGKQSSRCRSSSPRLSRSRNARSPASPPVRMRRRKRFRRKAGSKVSRRASPSRRNCKSRRKTRTARSSLPRAIASAPTQSRKSAWKRIASSRSRSANVSSRLHKSKRTRSSRSRRRRFRM